MAMLYKINVHVLWVCIVIDAAGLNAAIEYTAEMYQEIGTLFAQQVVDIFNVTVIFFWI